MADADGLTKFKLQGRQPILRNSCAFYSSGQEILTGILREVKVNE
jgi:hypothetical protein